MSKQSRNSKQLEEYAVDLNLSLTARAAHFLDWAARNRPHEPIPFNVIVRSIMNLPRTPKLDNPMVEKFRASASAGLRLAMIKRYNREIVSAPGIGIRATVDDADRLKNVAPMKARRLASARRSFMVTATGVDLANVPNTPEYLPLKTWMNRSVSDVIKMIGSKEFELKLLPPTTRPESKPDGA